VKTGQAVVYCKTESNVWHKFPIVVVTALKDTDGDGLPDVWEKGEADIDGDGIIDTFLKDMGADPNKSDIFVEVDWMRGFAPSNDALYTVYGAFQNSGAGYQNKGINLHIDAGASSIDYSAHKEWGSLSRATELSQQDTRVIDLSQNVSEWEHLADKWFDSVLRRKTFRWCLFADRFIARGHSSAADRHTGVAINTPGQWFIVARGVFSAQGEALNQALAGTFMHELGHTLGLHHGGSDEVNYKSNYLSVMNYMFQTTGLIGTNAYFAFTGIFDGNGYTVSNLIADRQEDTPYEIYAGLFGYLKNSTVKNIGLVGGKVIADATRNWEYAGAIAGRMAGNSSVINCFSTLEVKSASFGGGLIGEAVENAFIENCFNTGNVSETPDASQTTIGGIVGAISTAVVKGCYNDGEITAISSQLKGTGGIAGVYRDTSSAITDCYNTGTITASTKAGGILGDGNAQNCYNTGTVYGADLSGGITGNGMADNCHNSGDISSLNTAGGLVGSGSATAGYNTGKVTTDYFAGGIVGSGAATDCHNTGTIIGASFAGGISGANATTANCYNTGNVTTTGTNTAFYIGAGGITGYSNSSYSTITNCHNTGNITSQSSIADAVGGIVGYLNSTTTISDCYNTGTITANTRGGGIVGYFHETGLATIEKCFNLGEVTTTFVAGGIVGASSKITVSRCYNSGNIAGQLDVGGLVGSAISATIENCFNTGDVAANSASATGGIVGYIGGSLKNCYNAGFVVPSDAGGIAGMANAANLNDSYFLNATATKHVVGNISSKIKNVISLTATQMQQQDNFVGFDFDTVWDIDTSKNGGYPFLRGLPDPNAPELTNRTLTDTTTGVIVTGKLPVTTALVVSNANTLTVDTDTQELLAGYDITLQVNGQPIQPTGNVTVKIPIPAGTTDTSKLKVYRVETSGTQTDMNATAQGGYMMFTTDHFSWYVVVYNFTKIIHPSDGLVAIDTITTNSKTVIAYAFYNTAITQAQRDVDNDSLQKAGKDTYGLNCASLVKRYYQAIYDIDVGGLTSWDSKTDTYRDATPSVTSGSLSIVTAPQVGDIVAIKTTHGCWGDHWALVKSILNDGRVVIIEQNYPNMTKARIGHILVAGEGRFYRYSPPKSLTEPNSKIQVVYNDGVIPDGTVLTVDRIRDDSTWFEVKIDGQTFTVFYDINLVGNDGIAIHQLNGKVTVRIPFDKAATVYRVTEGKEKPDDMHADLKDGYLVFETDHFSVYGIAVNDQPAIETKDYFKLWGKVTKWEKTPLNWFLCIVLFGWIWMAF
jgi:hypothetical protein